MVLFSVHVKFGLFFIVLARVVSGEQFIGTQAIPEGFKSTEESVTESTTVGETKSTYGMFLTQFTTKSAIKETTTVELKSEIVTTSEPTTTVESTTVESTTVEATTEEPTTEEPTTEEPTTEAPTTTEPTTTMELTTMTGELSDIIKNFIFGSTKDNTTIKATSKKSRICFIKAQQIRLP